MEIVTKIAPIILALIMLGLGLGLKIEDFTRLLKTPKDFLIGFFSQLIILPLVAYLLIIILKVPPEIAIGVMIIAAVPGGITSNILTKTTSFLAFCFFLTSISLVIIANKNYKKESIIDSGEDSIIDRLDLIPEEFDVENKNEINIPTE